MNRLKLGIPKGSLQEATVETVLPRRLEDRHELAKLRTHG